MEKLIYQSTAARRLNSNCQKIKWQMLSYIYIINYLYTLNSIIILYIYIMANEWQMLSGKN